MKKLFLLVSACAIVLASCTKPAATSAKSSIPELQTSKLSDQQDDIWQSVTSHDDTVRPAANGSVIENFPNTASVVNYVSTLNPNWWVAADTGNNGAGYGTNICHLYQGQYNPALDLYTTTSTVPSDATISSVTVFATGCTNNNRGVGSPGSIKLGVRENATTTLGTSYTLPFGFIPTVEFSQTWSVRPSDGNSWIPSDINSGFEFGFSQTRPSGVGFTKTGHVYCIVSYTTP